eukprot:1188870-Prorocentrum_minimum.AAC.1
MVSVESDKGTPAGVKMKQTPPPRHHAGMVVPASAVVRTEAAEVLADADRFYRALLADTARTHSVPLDATQPSPGLDTVTPPLALCHFCLLCLGDVARYRAAWTASGPVDTKPPAG